MIKKDFKNILSGLKELIKFIIIIIAVIHIALFIFDSILIYNRTRNYFPDSDEYKWVCEEIDMYIIFNESCHDEVHITLYGKEWVIVATESFAKIDFEIDKIEGVRSTDNFILDAKKIRKDKIIFRVITDDLNLAPENGILTFVRVPIDAEE